MNVYGACVHICLDACVLPQFTCAKRTIFTIHTKFHMERAFARSFSYSISIKCQSAVAVGGDGDDDDA